jgi:hypothetical protein
VLGVWGFYQSLLNAACPMLARSLRKGEFPRTSRSYFFSSITHNSRRAAGCPRFAPVFWGANLGSVVFESTAQRRVAHTTRCSAGGPHNAVFVVWGFTNLYSRPGAPCLRVFFRKGGFHELVDGGKSGAPRLLIRYNVESLDRRPKCLVQASKPSL